MENYKVIDFENWPRKNHYLYYTNLVKAGYSMTVNIDVAKLVSFCKRKGYKFYPTFIYCTSAVVNSTENLRIFKNKDGMPCVWDKVVPNYTIFHDDDKTFSDIWTDFDFSFDTFYKNITRDIEKYKDVKGIKAKEGQPPNFFCISCVPWISYTGYSTYSGGGDPTFFPIITFGKYTEEKGTFKMPFTLTIAHAVCDGYHTGKFFNDLQMFIDNFAEEKEV